MEIVSSWRNWRSHKIPIYAEEAQVGDLVDMGQLRILAHGEEQIKSSYIVQDLGLVDRWDYLDSTRHFVVRDHGHIVASGRVCFHRDISFYSDYIQFPAEVLTLFKGGRIATLDKLVVHPEYRQQGLSKLIDQARIEYALSHKVDHIVACILGEVRKHSLHALGFIKRAEIVSRPLNYTKGLFTLRLMSISPACK